MKERVLTPVVFDAWETEAQGKVPKVTVVLLMCELSCLCDKEGSQQRRLERRLGGESMNGVPTEKVSTHPSPPVLIAKG